MAITQWTDKIHECQKGEVQRERCYLEPYYFFTGNLNDYSQLLKYAYNNKHTENQSETNREYDSFLEKHPICFHPHDIKKGCSPTYVQLQNWSRGQNIDCDIKYSWDDRRTSKRNEVNRLAEENIAAKLTEDLPWIYEEILKGISDTKEAVMNSKKMGNFTPHQAESATKSKLHVVDSLQKITGEDKKYNIKADVDTEIVADVKQQTNAEVKVKQLQELKEKMDTMTYD